MVDHLERHNANVARGDAPARRGGDRGLRGAPATRWRRSSARRAATRWSSPRTPPRRSTWSPTRCAVGAAATCAGRPGRRGRHHRDGAPLQHRAVAAAHRAHRRDAALVRRSPTTAGSTCPNIDELINERTKVVVVHLGLQHARHDQPGRRDRRAAPTRSARSSCSTPRQAVPQLPVDVGRARRRLPGLHRPQDASARPASACSGAARELLDALPPFLGGGEMIETVTMERSTYAAAAAQVRGRHAADRRGGRPRRRGRLPRRARHGRASHAHEQAHHGVRAGRRWPSVAGRARPRPARRRRARGRDRVRARRRAPARRRPGARRARHRRPGRATTAPSRLHARFGVQASTRASFVPLHDAGRDRRAGRGPATTPGATSSWGER